MDADTVHFRPEGPARLWAGTITHPRDAARTGAEVHQRSSRPQQSFHKPGVQGRPTDSTGATTWVPRGERPQPACHLQHTSMHGQQRAAKEARCNPTPGSIHGCTFAPTWSCCYTTLMRMAHRWRMSHACRQDVGTNFASRHVRRPSMSLSCFSCVRPSLRLYLYAYTSFWPRLASNSRRTWERSSPTAHQDAPQPAHLHARQHG